jgi:type I restriction enzyme M protein
VVLLLLHENWRLFDLLRNDYRPNESFYAFLLSEAIKKISIDQKLPLKKIWEDIARSSSYTTAVKSLFKNYNYEELAKITESLSSLNGKVPNALVSFSIQNSDLPLSNIEDFLKIYERVSSMEGTMSSNGIPQLGYDLMANLIEIQNAESVYDGALRQANSILTAYKKNPKADIYAEVPYHPDYVLSVFTSFLYMNNNNLHISESDALRSPAFLEKEDTLRRFDCILLSPPFNMQSNYDYTRDRFGRFIYGELTKRDTTLAYILHSIAVLKEGGRGSIMVAASNLFRGGREGRTRTEILKSDFIEAVIQLPSSILTTTSIPPFLIVINKKKDKNRTNKVLMINATDLYEQHGRSKVLTEKIVEYISEIFHEGKEIEGLSKFISCDEIIENEANLLPDRYLLQDDLYFPILGSIKLDKTAWEHTTKLAFDELAEITNGSNMTPSDKGIPRKIIKASDIQNGEVLLHQIEETKIIAKKNDDKSLIKPGDVLMLSRGNNPKIAVVPEISGKYYASTNIMIIRPNKMVNPYYLQAYLESPLGQMQLQNIQTGTSILMWPVRDFKKLLVPQKTETEQDRIAKQFTEARTAYKNALLQAESELNKAKLKVYEDMGLLDVIIK